MAKWQPIMLIAEERLECECGALAIFLLFQRHVRDGIEGAMCEPLCQPCFEKRHDEEEENE